MLIHFTSLKFSWPVATFPNVGGPLRLPAEASRLRLDLTAVCERTAVRFLNTELCEWTRRRKPFLHCVCLWAELFPHWTCDNRACKSPLFFSFFLLPDGSSKHASLFGNTDGDIIGNHWFCLMATSKHSKCTPLWIPQTSQWCLPTYSVGALPAPL